MKGTRLITIKRFVEETVKDKNGAQKTVKVAHLFPCKINASVPYSHNMCEQW